jgi:uncharacterized protein (DUF1800 family)
MQTEPGSQPQRTSSRTSPRAAMSPIKPADFGPAQARHLLWRAGFGGTSEQIRTLVEWGPERSVDHLLDASSAAPEPNRFSGEIIRPPTPEQQMQIRAARRNQDEETLARLRLIQQERERDDRRQMREIQRWWLTKMIESAHPLEEKMTLFWHGHFATAYRPVENSYHMYLQNGFFRSNALGSFADLLYGIVRDPAMLAYLDQNESRRQRPNENLARELMELFGLGAGNYTEQDIKEGARALTGHTFNHNEFVFRQREHDPNPKRILARSGTLKGEDFVTAILEQRACSIFIARKLYHYFVADIPNLTAPERDLPASVRTAVSDLSLVMRERRYQIKPVMRRLFLSEHFYSEPVRNQQIKSPVQLVVGAIRSLHTPARDLGTLLDALELMGQNIFNPPSVKGWDGGRSWINTSTLFIRQNILAFLLTGKRPRGYDALAATERYDPLHLIREIADTTTNHDRIIEELLRFTLGRIPPDAAAQLKNYLVANEVRTLTTEHAIALLLLITAMPEYQLC